MSAGSRRSIGNLAVLALLAAAGWSAVQGPAAPAAPGAFDLKAEQRTLDRIISTRGLEAAHAHFTQAYPEVDPVALHSLGHYIGERIYEERGLAGVKICDDSYSFGCYHGVFVSAFSAEGEDAVPRAAEICKELAASPLMGSCVHGVGHGIMGLRSYDLAGLRGALATCDLLAEDLRHECWHGTFMEYNRRTPMAVQKAPIRPFDPDHPLSPCDEVESRYRTACYVEQTAWWSMTIGVRDQESAVRKIGAFCAEVPEGPERESCWNGIGLMLPLGGADPAATIRHFCMLLSPASAEAHCLTSGLRLMVGYGKKAAPEVCDVLPFPYGAECRRNLAEFVCARGSCDP